MNEQMVRVQAAVAMLGSDAFYADEALVHTRASPRIRH